MFGRSQLDIILQKLRDEIGFFVSEAHFQMSFVLKGFELFSNEFAFIPEYPIIRDESLKIVDYIDLCIVDSDTSELTFIEFKHKTSNTHPEHLKVTMRNVNIEFSPTRMLAENPARFDCWSDIERLERHKEKGHAANCFFVFLTNNPKFWEEDGTGSRYGSSFGLNESHYDGEIKCWSGWDDQQQTIDSSRKRGIGRTRNRAIVIHHDYDFDWADFIRADNDAESSRSRELGRCMLYRRLIVNI